MKKFIKFVFGVTLVALLATYLSREKEAPDYPYPYENPASVAVTTTMPANGKSNPVIIVSSPTEPERRVESAQTMKFDATRSGFDIGTCLTLKEDAAIIVLCADDDESNWDSQEIITVHKQVESAAQYLRSRGADYGVNLTLPVYLYATDEYRQIRYDGTIQTGGKDCDALESIARNWGFEDKWHMHSTLSAEFEMDQLIYIVVHNKSGPCFGQAGDYSSIPVEQWNMPEYCIVSFPTDTNRTVTFLHEMLHLFGAQDFYRKEFGSTTALTVYNEDRANLAKTLCPNEVMLCSCYDIGKVQLSDFTAYTIGWLDTLPAEYDCPEWWVGSQWEDLYAPGVG